MIAEEEEINSDGHRLVTVDSETGACESRNGDSGWSKMRVGAFIGEADVVVQHIQNAHLQCVSWKGSYQSPLKKAQGDADLSNEDINSEEVAVNLIDHDLVGIPRCR